MPAEIGAFNENHRSDLRDRALHPSQNAPLCAFDIDLDKLRRSDNPCLDKLINYHRFDRDFTGFSIVAVPHQAGRGDIARYPHICLAPAVRCCALKNLDTC